MLRKWWFWVGLLLVCVWLSCQSESERFRKRRMTAVTIKAETPIGRDSFKLAALPKNWKFMDALPSRSALKSPVWTPIGYVIWMTPEGDKSELAWVACGKLPEPPDDWGGIESAIRTGSGPSTPQMLPPGAVRFLHAPRWNAERATLVYAVPGTQEVYTHALLFGNEGVLRLTMRSRRAQLGPIETLADRLSFAPGKSYNASGPPSSYSLSDLMSGRQPPTSAGGAWVQQVRSVLTAASLLGSFGLVALAMISYGRFLRHNVRRPDQPQPGGEPAYRQYWFGRWWRDLRDTVGDSLAAVQQFGAVLTGRVGSLTGYVLLGEQSAQGRLAALVSGFLAFVIPLVSLPGMLLAGALFLVFTAIAALVMSLCALVAQAAAGFFSLLERASMLWRSIAIACPNRSCYRKVALPIYLCPRCGAEHRRLIPGRYGTLKRKCQCGQELPTLFLVGRNRLDSLCPHCRCPLTVVLTRSLHLPVVGGPGAGKSSLLTAMLSELARAGTPLDFPQRRDAQTFEAACAAMAGGWVPAKTAEFDPDAFLVRMGDQVVYLYDAAGELFEASEHLRRHEYLGYSHGFFLLIDPHAEDHQEIYDRMMRAFRELSHLGGKRSPRPIAVVLSKCDALPPGTDPRQWLLDHGRGNLVRDLEGSFEKVRYFAVSALGRAADQAGQPFQPCGVLEPLRWLISESR